MGAGRQLSRTTGRYVKNVPMAAPACTPGRTCFYLTAVIVLHLIVILGNVNVTWFIFPV